MQDKFGMHEDRLSAHRFRWLAGMLAAVIGLLLWQNWTLRSELRRLHDHVEEAVATAEDASEYARQARNYAGDPQATTVNSPVEPRIEYRRIPEEHGVIVGQYVISPR
jgi:hypothetical protein